MKRRIGLLLVVAASGFAACGSPTSDSPVLVENRDPATPDVGPTNAVTDAAAFGMDVSERASDAASGADAVQFADAEQDSESSSPDASDPGLPDLAPGPDAGEPDPGSTDYPLPPIPANCALKSQVITYNPNGWGLLLDAFEANSTPCADYYIFLPAIAGNKVMPRGGPAPSGVRARAGRFHAVAEFHWGAWSNVAGMSWYEKGVEFRRRMDAAGYDVARGDTWGLNELPSSTRSTASTRTAVRNLVKGLYDGPPGARKRAGVVFVIGMGQGTMNHSVYKPALKSWLTDSAFWADMDANVLWWSQEAYSSPSKSCVPDAQIGARAQNINQYIHHKARLAAAGPSGAGVARSFFNQAYAPTLTAVWHSDAYGQTQIGLDAMKKFVSLQIYANRAWVGSHNYPDGRVAIAWDNNAPSSTVAQRTELAERIAAAVAGAYAVDGTASKACSPSGAYTWCGCSTSGATFNTTWSTYDAW